MKTIVTIEKVIEQRDVDAALFLIQRMLDLSDDAIGVRRVELRLLQARLKKNRKFNDSAEKQQIVRLYREVVG